MLLATLYGLTAAVLHAGWNLIAKRAIDPFLALWGQFLLAGLVSGAALVVVGSVPAASWGWATLSGLIHVPYVVGLAHAYRRGDFSLAYPVARGGGALVAAIGGVAILGDVVSPTGIVAIVVVVGGMGLLAVGAPWRQVATAAAVAATIGAYTIVDSHAARQGEGVGYVFAVFAMIGATTSVVGVAAGRLPALMRIGPDQWRRAALAAATSIVTYGLVLLAVRRAPVGYVAALRESSVLIAAVIGWRLLDESRGRLRTAAAVVIVLGLVVLVATG